MFKKESAGRLAISFFGVGAAATLMFTELSTFSISSYGVVVGSKTSATAMLISMPKSPMPTVAFTSSNKAVALVPPSRLANANGTVIIDVTAVAPGCATITASYGSRTRLDDVVVHAPLQTSAFTFKVPDQVLYAPGTWDATLTHSVSLGSGDRSLPGGSLTIKPVVWSVSSSNRSVASVPDSVTQVSTSTSFKIKAISEGCAVITARLGTQSISKTVMTRYIPG